MIDKTNRQRQSRRRQALNQAAQELGYPSWGKLETDVINRSIIIQIVKQEAKMSKYIVLHVGYPVAGRQIREDEWSELSRHASENAAWQAVNKARTHLSDGQWDNHYRVVGPDGQLCDRELFYIKENTKKSLR